MKYLLPALITLLCFSASPGCFAQQGYRTEKLSLDNHWLFHKGNIPFPPIKGHGASYLAAKAGAARGAAAIEYDDAVWQTVNIPHDWAIEDTVDAVENLAQGYRKRGWGWYRRRFQLGEADKGKNIELQLEGIATHATIWVNGQEVYHSYSAYTSVYVDISAIARFGDNSNTIAIRVDAESMEGWWYEGAGIYRHAWLVKRPPVHIVTDGVYANPVKRNNNWFIPAEVTVRNIGAKGAVAVVRMDVYGPGGDLVASGKRTARVAALEKHLVRFNVPIPSPTLWRLERPALYTVKTVVASNGQVDEWKTTCGFRTLRFDADSGFYLNGQRVKIKGVCNHIDHAGVGVAVPDALWDFRMEKLKETGANAYRCSHNPPAVHLLDLCDSLGILVMDENRNFNAAPEYLGQLEWMVRRDRNHPAVILWSVFNEEPIQGTATGYEMVRRMARQVKLLDTTRPVTAAMNGGFFAPVNVSQAVDVTGFNYEIGSYDRFHRENPQVPVISSEDASALMIRGVYTTDSAKHLLGSYDTEKPAWGATHRESWKAIDQRPWMAGCFVWTGFDYHGEPTPYSWPTVNSSFGILDICGFPKAAFYLRRALWIEQQPVLHLVPHWNWPVDSIGKPIKVMAFSNADEVALLLNGQLLGKKQNDRYDMVSWEVPYAPGKLEAIGYKGNKAVARFSVETTGVPVRLRLTPYKRVLNNDGKDVTTVTVEALDAQGRPVPVAATPVIFQVKGSGKIIGLGNGNPSSHEPEKGNRQSLFNGLAQVIVQSEAGSTLPLKLIAMAEGLEPDTLTIALQAVPPPPVVPEVARTFYIDNWRVSPFYTIRPDPDMAIADNDMNSWPRVHPGELQKVPANRQYVIYRATFLPSSAQQSKGAAVVVQAVAGKAELWLDGKPVAWKRTTAPGDMHFQLPAGDQLHTISLLMVDITEPQVGIGGKTVVD